MKKLVVVFAAVIFLLILIILIIIRTSSSDKDEPKYTLANGSVVGNGYNVLSSDNAYLTLISQLKEVHQKDGNVFAKFATKMPNGKTVENEFIVFDRKLGVSFYLTRQRVDRIFPDSDKQVTISMKTDKEINDALKKYNGKNLILLINVGSLTSQLTQYRPCNELFYQSFIASKKTDTCDPLLYQVTAYEP